MLFNSVLYLIIIKLINRRLVLFEDEIRDALDAGMRASSGQTAWTFANSMLLAYSLASTTGRLKEQHLFRMRSEVEMSN